MARPCTKTTNINILEVEGSIFHGKTYLSVAVINESRALDEEEDPVDKVRDKTAVGDGWNIERDSNPSRLREEPG